MSHVLIGKDGREVEGEVREQGLTAGALGISSMFGPVTSVFPLNPLSGF